MPGLAFNTPLKPLLRLGAGAAGAGAGGGVPEGQMKTGAAENQDKS